MAPVIPHASEKDCFERFIHARSNSEAYAVCGDVLMRSGVHRFRMSVAVHAIECGGENSAEFLYGQKAPGPPSPGVRARV